MTELIRYEAARAALAVASSIDEVKDIHDFGRALAAYARQAKDDDLIRKANDIRVRAEIRLGEMIIAQKETVGLAKGGQPYQAKSTGSSTGPVAPTLAAAGIDKKLSARSQKLAMLSEPERDAHLAAVNRQATDALRATTTEKQQRRAQREADLSARQLALPAKRYGVIYADPPWRFEVYSRDTGLDRDASNHYPVQALEQIGALDVASIAAADDCVLYLWATVPMLPQALEVMVAWGFKYVSGHTWVKTNAGSEGLERMEATRAGTGYWIRNEHELLLVGKRGRIPAPAQGTQIGSVIMAPVGRHSAKPLIVVETIERHYPNLPKIELFARGEARPGWDAWGNEVTSAEKTKTAKAG